MSEPFNDPSGLVAASAGGHIGICGETVMLFDRQFVRLEDYIRVRGQLAAAEQVVQAAHKLSQSFVGFGSVPQLGASGVLMVALNEALFAYDQVAGGTP
jgi:hypothetical protein